MGQGLDIGALFAALLRRAWLIIAIFIVGVAITSAVAVLLPPVYTATSKILVQSQQIPSDLARSTVTAGTAERLELIRQRLMTRDNLLKLADQFNLYADRKDLTTAQRVGKLRDATIIESVPLDPSNRRNGQIGAFTITFSTDDGPLAARVANEFVTLILEQNLRNRVDRATETSAFFRSELTRIRDDLGALESNIADFKRTNEATLPETLAMRRTESSAIREQVFEVEGKLVEARDAMRILQATLAGDAEERVEIALPERQSTPSERDLARAQAELRNQLAVLSNNHPRVRVLRRQVAALEAAVAREAAAAGTDTSEVDGASVQDRLRNAELNARIAEVDNEIEFLEARRVELLEREATLLDTIKSTPSIELTLNRMARQRQDLQAQYNQVVAKLAEAEIGEVLEVNRQAERFEVIEQAEAPRRPVSPNRTLIFLAGCFLSLGFGVGLVVLLELLNKRIRTTSDLERSLEIRPFSVIPYIRTAQEIRRIWFGWIAGMMLLVGLGSGAAYAVDRYYLPLSVVAQKVIDRSGVDTAVEIIRNRLDRD